MILAVDIGNTNISVAGFESDGEISLIESYPDNMFHSAGEFYNKLRSLKLKTEGAVLCSVVPSLGKMAETALMKLTDGKVTVIDSSFPDGMKISGYDRRKLGNDRIADMTAAKVLYGAPAVVIDMGTASTISVIDRNGAYLGGVISAGVRLTLKALSENTAQLPSIDISAPKSVISTNTVDCMRSGLIYGTAAMLDGLLDRITDELGEMPTVVATGGLSKDIITHCKNEIIYNANLLLDGLREIYEKNR